ncbi:PIN domain-containing protein [Candidatus Poribacteria bacterium]|nr:PIN domain-containing protein [Candidatus Poribacteria bacterium]
MKQYVTDTTGLIRHLAKSKKQGKNASKIFEEADRGNCIVFIPVMVLMEILYLSEKSRISTTLPDVTQFVQNSTNYRIYSITGEVVLKAKEVTDIPELHDKVIAATAVLLGFPLISKDSVINQSRFLETIW